jgi:hypothetical protein
MDTRIHICTHSRQDRIEFTTIAWALQCCWHDLGHCSVRVSRRDRPASGGGRHPRIVLWCSVTHIIRPLHGAMSMWWMSGIRLPSQDICLHKCCVESIGSCTVDTEMVSWWWRGCSFSLVATLCTLNRNVVISKLDRDTEYPDWGFYCFPVIPGKWEIEPQLGQNDSVPNFRKINDYNILNLYIVWTLI